MKAGQYKNTRYITKPRLLCRFDSDFRYRV
jgi:hypothetical protein